MLTLAVCLAGGIAHADIEYQFNVNATGPMDAFSFSFTSPTFVGGGATPAFTPFTVMDDLTPQNSWTMTQDLVCGNPTLFEFGTAGADLFSITTGAFPGCGFGLNAGTDGGFFLDVSALPTATGTYGINGGNGIFGFGASQALPRNFTGSLTVSNVSAVPEPTSILLFGSILGAVGWRVRRRRAPGSFRA
jgi:hypothetical protein